MGCHQANYKCIQKNNSERTRATTLDEIEVFVSVYRNRNSSIHCIIFCKCCVNVKKVALTLSTYN